MIYGCANQAGEEHRNVARMSALLAGLPLEVPGTTVNRLCGSGMDAIGTAARAIRSGEAQLMIAGGIESMSREPFVMPKAESAFSRSNAIHDTTIGWRFVNALMKEKYGVDSMPETAENVASQFKIEREAQDRMALASQQKAVAAQKSDFFGAEITAVTIAQMKGEALVVARDEHPRAAQGLAVLRELGLADDDARESERRCHRAGTPARGFGREAGNDRGESTAPHQRDDVFGSSLSLRAALCFTESAQCVSSAAPRSTAQRIGCDRSIVALERDL